MNLEHTYANYVDDDGVAKIQALENEDIKALEQIKVKIKQLK